MEESSLFWEIHRGLPREGPGSNECTFRAFSLLNALPAKPRILDIGCGPGAQTFALAGQTKGRITALDTHQPFLNGIKARAAQAGISGRIITVNASMDALPFEPESFDVIWVESAIFIIGFTQGLTNWKPFLAPGGYLVVSELCWLKAEMPEEIRKFWREAYPQMSTMEECSKVVVPTVTR